MLEHALGYAKRGWRVVPIKPNAKTPLLKDWPNQASTDPKVITDWWSKFPNANVGIVTGKLSGLVVLDLDRKGDVDGVAAAEAKWNWDRPEVCQQTGSGGLQSFYSWPQEVEIRNKAELDGTKGVDVRGEGGFVVVPPSIHPCGNAYQWLGDPNNALEPPPAWLIDLCRVNALSNTHERGGGQPCASGGILGAVSEGARNATLASIAGTMRRRGLSESSIYAALAAENAERCHPPLDDKEVRTIATSVARYAPAPVQPEAEPVDVESNADANPPVEALEALMVNNRKFAATWSRKRDDFCKPEQYDYALAAFAATVGWTNQQIADLVVANRRKYNQPPASKDELGRIVGQALHLTRQTRAILAINATPTGGMEAPQVMNKISDVLGIKVNRFIQHGREKSRYILELEGGRQVVIGGAAEVLSVVKFRSVLMDATGIIFPTVKQHAWDDVCRVLLGAAEFLENEETTAAWQGAAWVESYLESVGEIKEQPGDTWKDAYRVGSPFIKDGMLHISASRVATHIRIQYANRITHPDLCETLRQAGFVRTAMSVRIKDKIKCKSLWTRKHDV